MKRFLFLILLLLPWCLRAQETLVDSLSKKMNAYGIHKPVPALFVHFDKTVYTSNEVAWFTAYLLRANDAPKHHVFSVALVSAYDKKVIAQKQFVMAAGISFGDLRLPDSIPAGRYLFLSYTDLVQDGVPVQEFVQPITIKTVTDPPFSASLSLPDSSTADGFYKVRFEGFTKERMLLSGASLRWRTSAEKKLSEAKTNERGEYEFRIPVAEIDAANPVFETEVTLKKEVRKLKIRLPAATVKPNVKILPEGGSMVEETVGNVAIEALTRAGAPVIAPVTVYENGEPLLNLYLNSNGVCRFMFTPKPGNTYSAKLLGFDFPFPKAVRYGPSVALRRGTPDDTLNLVIIDRRMEKLQLLVHDYRSVFFSTSVNSADMIALKLPLKDVPRGLAVLTILDDEGRPYAERLFFAHYNDGPRLVITPAKESFQQREKVPVQLELKDKDGNPMQGVVSIACVQSNRLEFANRTDIENFYHLQSKLADLTPDPTNDGVRNNEYLENMLLVKGWRRYTWQDLVANDVADTSANFSQLEFSGVVTRYTKPLKKALGMSSLIGGQMRVFQTEADGTFVLRNPHITMFPDQKALFMVADKNQQSYAVEIINPYAAVNKTEVAGLPSAWLTDRAESPKTESTMIARGERAIMLNEVKLVAKTNDNNIRGTLGANGCGDYVCRYNIFNCPNHYGQFDNIQPVKGVSYQVPGRGNIVYQGCEREIRTFVATPPGIYHHKEFYGSDYSKNNPPEPEYFSTIFWKHGLIIDEDGKISFDFYTSDIVGQYSIIVQGITKSDVIFGQANIQVTRKKEL